VAESRRGTIFLACSKCGKRRYCTTKNKKNNSERMVLRKHCNQCNEHTEHKETK